MKRYAALLLVLFFSTPISADPLTLFECKLHTTAAGVVARGHVVIPDDDEINMLRLESAMTHPKDPMAIAYASTRGTGEKQIMVFIGERHLRRFDSKIVDSGPSEVAVSIEANDTQYTFSCSK